MKISNQEMNSFLLEISKLELLLLSLKDSIPTIDYLFLKRVISDIDISKYNKYTLESYLKFLRNRITTNRNF